MIKKVLQILCFATLFFCLSSISVLASEVEGDLTVDTGVDTGIEGILIVAPTASPVAGTYHSTQSVSLTASGSTGICYTTDGTTPVCNGAYACTTGSLYSSAISITSTKTLKSIACYANQTSNSVSSDTYTLTCSVSSVSNGSVGAYPGCAITCNSGYTLSGSTCVADTGGGGGGGGGGGTSMPNTDDGEVTATHRSGGKTTLTDPDGNKAQVKVSSDTVDSNTDFKITAVGKDEDTVSGLKIGIGNIDGDFVGNYFYNFTAEDDGEEITEFSKNVKVTIYYDEDALGTIDEEDLVIHYWDDENEEWVATESTVYRSVDKVVTYVDHFTYFALFGTEGTAADIDTGGEDVSDMTTDEIKALIQQLLIQIAIVQQALAELGGTSEIADIPSNFSFTRDLKSGMTGTDVKYLQIVLNSDPSTRIAASGVGSPGHETNYFGSLTKAAVIRFQERHHNSVLDPWGFSNGTGYVGRTTKDKLNDLLGK